MPGPDTARDRPTRGGTPHHAATAARPAAGPATLRLREGLDGYRRQISRQRSAAAVRRWSLITLIAALAGVAAGRLDGNVVMTAAAAIALALAAGAVSVVRRRRVRAEDAARQLDAAFGFDEQVATALCCAEPGVGTAGGATDRNLLVAELIERAAALVARAEGVQGPRPVPAYGDWAVMAVTAAAVAAVAAGPGSHPATLATAAGGSGRGSALASATAAPRPAHAGGVIPGNAGTPDATATTRDRTAPPTRGASAEKPTGTGARTAPEAAAPTAPATGSATASPAKPGARPSSANPGAEPSSANPGAPTSPGANAAGAAGHRSAAARAGGSGQRGSGPPVAGQSPPTRAATTPSPTTRAATTPAATTRPSASQSATAQQAPGARGTAAHGGRPSEDAAGTERGNDRTSARQAQLPVGGNTMLLILLSGGDGTAPAPDVQGAPGQQPEGDGGNSTVIQTATAPGNSAEYVPPDQNEIPFPDQGLLGRYF